MKYLKYLFLVNILLVLSLASGCKKSGKTQAALAREEWITSLNDSIAEYQATIDSCTSGLERLHASLEEELKDFTLVSNPREVAGYYILDGWQSKYPLQKTGIVARISEDEGLEVVAVLSKGVFNHLKLECENETYISPVVPHDQALNYKTSEWNSVCFTGSAADSIAMFIANHSNGKINLSFIENKTSGAFVVPQDEKAMITSTWNLYKKRREVKELEKTMSLYSGKINACRRILETNDTIKP